MIKMKDANALSLEEIAYVLKNKSLIVEFLNAVEARAITEELNGHDVPGFKVVEGRSNRAWGRSEKDVADSLVKNGMDQDDLWTRKIISPAQAEKKLGKKVWAKIQGSLVFKPKGKPTLTVDGDKREALQNMSEDFDFVDELDL